MSEALPDEVQPKHGVFIDTGSNELRAYWKGDVVSSITVEAAKDKEGLRAWIAAVTNTVGTLGSEKEFIDFMI